MRCDLLTVPVACRRSSLVLRFASNRASAATQRTRARPGGEEGHLNLSELEQVFRDAPSRALLDGEYALLLGAGASLGGHSADGRPLPGSVGFAAELISALGLSVAPDTPLPYVWEAALHRVGSERDLVSRHLIPRFRGCQPGPEQRALPTFPWTRIFTFNVDDVVEAAYRAAPSRLQEVVPLHFDSEYREAELEQDRVQLIYLHGSVAWPGEPVVFGPPAYAAAATKQHTWWHVLADTFLSQPMIVVGASLREPDFEAYLALKRRSPVPLSVPSFFVSPDIDDAVVATCSRLGLVPVAAKMVDFLSCLGSLLPSRERLSVRRARPLAASGFLEILRSTPVLATLSRQFVDVSNPESWPVSGRAPEAFYEGVDPSWSDIQEARDIEVAAERRLLHGVNDVLTGHGGQRIAVGCLFGTAGSGKTTALMRAASALAGAGRRVLFFIGHDRLRDDILTTVAEGLGPDEWLTVCVDDIDQHIEQVRRLLVDHAQRGRGSSCLEP